MVAEHPNGASPFGGLEANTADRLLEALAEMDLDPADRIPTESAILLAHQLGLTQQELSEAHAELKRRMETEAAPDMPRKRFTPKQARGIKAQIGKPKLERSVPEMGVMHLDFPQDLYADQPETVRTRVYRVVRANGVDLRYPVAARTTQAIAFAAGTQPRSLRGIFNAIREDLGIVCLKAPARETPITLPTADEVPTATPALVDQVEAAVDARGIDLAQPAPSAFVDELAAGLGRTNGSILSAIKMVRRRKGIRVAAAHRVAQVQAVGSRERDPATGHFLRADGTNATSAKQDARALALEIAAELRRVEGEKRPQALIQAGRLVEKLLG